MSLWGHVSPAGCSFHCSTHLAVAFSQHPPLTQFAFRPISNFFCSFVRSFFRSNALHFIRSPFPKTAFTSIFPSAVQVPFTSTSTAPSSSAAWLLLYAWHLIKLTTAFDATNISKWRKTARGRCVASCGCVESCILNADSKRKDCQRLLPQLMQFPVAPPPSTSSPAVRDNSSGNGSANVKSRRQQQKFNKMETIKCTELKTPKMRWSIVFQSGLYLLPTCISRNELKMPCILKANWFHFIDHRMYYPRGWYLFCFFVFLVSPGYCSMSKLIQMLAPALNDSCPSVSCESCAPCMPLG